MKKFVLLCLLIASPAFANDMDMRWFTTPGDWVVPGFIEPSPHFAESCRLADKCVGVEFQAKWNEPSCFRYEDVFITKDGKVVPATVTETGTPGQPGWIWTYDSEPFEGNFEFHIKTIDVCPKVG